MPVTLTTFCDLSKRHLSWVSLLGCLWLGMQPLVAQSFRLEMQKDSFEVGEIFELAFILQANESVRPDFPNLEPLRLVGVPREEQQPVMVDGELQQVTVFRYQLQGMRPGSYRVGAATVRIDGTTLQTSPRTVHILAVEEELSEEDRRIQAALERELEKNIWVETTVSDRSVYVGQPIDVTYDLWTAADLSSQIGSRRKEATPQFPGFTSIQQPFRNELVLEFRRGRRYLRSRASEFRLIPQSAGTFELGRQVISMTVAIPRAGRTPQNDLETFQRQFQPGFREYRYESRSRPVSVEVRPLPAEDRPLDFSGLVGELDLTLPWQGDTLVQTGQELTLSLRYEGDVDWGVFTPPALRLPPDVEAYPPRVASQDSQGQGRLVQYTLVARKAGRFPVPVPSWSYFDVSTRRYRTVGGDTLYLQVSGESLSGAAGTDSLATGQGPVFTDLLPLPDQASNDSPVGWSRWLGPGLWGPWVLFALVAWFRYRWQQRRQDPDYRRRQALRQAVRGQLRRAQAARADGRAAALMAALWSGFGGLLELPPSQQTAVGLKRAMAAADWPPERQQQALALLQRCHQAAYGAQPEDPPLLAQVKEFLSELLCEEQRGHSQSRLQSTAALLLVALPWLGFGQDPVQAYEQGNYAEARAEFDSMAARGLESAALYHNLGSAAYRSGDLGKAVWAYEKALRLDPWAQATRDNLRYVRQELNSRILPRPEWQIELYWRGLRAWLPEAGWVWLAWAANLGLIFMLVSRWWRKAAWQRWAAVPLVLMLALAGLVQLDLGGMMGQQEAIVMRKAMLREAPEGQQDLLDLAAGVKVYPTDAVAGWVEVRIEDPEAGELVGYLPENSIRKL